jgi:enterochelin esterase-like enzyme
MRNVILALAFAAALPAFAQSPTAAAPATSGRPSPYNFANVPFPRIEADNKVTFQFTAPEAKKVQVNIVGKDYDMVKGENGLWTYTTPEPQAPGYHNYWMVVDGTIVLDPNTEAFIGYSHMCNGFEIPDPDGAFYQIKDVPHGSVLTKSFYSKTSNAWRPLTVYTPPGYETNASTRYPVLYLQHGGGEDQRVWTEMGRTNVILDNLLAEGKIKPFIVVMETSVTPGPRGGGPGRAAGAPPAGAAPAARGAAPAGAPAAGAPPAAPGRGGPGGGRGGFNVAEFEKRLLEEVIPFVDANFRTLKDQPNRAMAGLSMGAAQTHQITMAHLDMFSHIGLFSGGNIAMSEITDMPAFKKQVKATFFSYGSQENGSAAAKTATEALKQAGVNAHFYESPGTAHEWQSWRRSLREFAPLLFRN